MEARWGTHVKAVVNAVASIAVGIREHLMFVVLEDVEVCETVVA